jgi:predicted nucleic acid-binding protein
MPYEAVVTWVAAQQQAELFTTAVTEAEILLGIALLPQGARRNGLAAAARAMFADDFASRVLPFDGAAATVFSEIVSRRVRDGKPIGQADAQVAAIARSRGAALATRNVGDFQECGVRIVNPWAG